MAEVDVPQEVPAETSSENPSEKKLSADAFQNFIQGKRHMLVQDFSNAVASLADACELYVEHFGQTAPECAEVYFHYGKALFRLFQQQAGIIGNLVSDESSNEDGENSDSEEDKEKENTDENENENENENEESDGEDLGDEDETSKDEADSGGKTDTEKSEQVEKSSEKSHNCTAKEPPEEEKEKVAEVTTTTSEENEAKPVQNLDEAGPSCPRPKTEEEISDLQLAWETLETAKSIFKRQGDDCQESRLKVAEILLILAEISMELENYKAAVDDLWECLKIREQYLEPDDRLIAETFYQMGLAHTFAGEVDMAIQNYQRSIDSITLRISNLKKQTVIQKTPEGFDINPAEEIAELEAVLPDIVAKMEDTKDMVQDTKNLMKELMFQNVEEENTASSSSDKPVTNITHLLKRKKPDDQEQKGSVEVKRLKLNAVEDEQMKPDSSTSDGASNA